ncbi:MAG TPA: fasciclin domain-containing protein [Bacteroidales bacterium]|nr:fasciclin domain-containing protein [Bacteroidales bacterium]
MKSIVYTIISLIIIAGITGCEEKWNEHYNDVPETVDQNIWDALKSKNEVSSFVSLMEEFGLDSIFNHDDIYTFFIPTNEAIQQYTDTAEMTKAAVAYHILHQYIQPNNISSKRKIQTLMLKFAQFEREGDQYWFDKIPVVEVSPLYNDGRYFMIEQVSTPKPSLYEYISRNNKALKYFIDEMDTVILDKELSKPIGFDDEGNTIYDSVVNVYNFFELGLFEVSEELRLKTATMAFPTQDKYNQALNKMATDLGYSTYEDIPRGWQQDVLMPYLVFHGFFANLREEYEFTGDSVKNILGDSVELIFNPVNQVLCSNGYAYDYDEFTILDSLYFSPLRTEGESLLKSLGNDRFAWNDSIVDVESDDTFRPDGDPANDVASNDSILVVRFENGYEGKYNLEFKTKPLFPRKHLFVVRTHMDFGGKFNIYVNDELVKEFDYYSFMRFGGEVMPSVVSGKRYIAQGRYQKFDFWVDNLTEYGRAKIRFEYTGPGNTKWNGIFLDYVGFYPEESLDKITKNP